jgi:hypothetical protein
MTPRATRQLTPNLHEIGWSNFQRLCNELFAHEPEIDASNEYGKPGQGQHGIDLLAQVRPTGFEVGQCKCEVSFSVRKIQKASDEFFAHWTHWKDKGIRRFILFAGCDVNQTELQNEMLNQRARFAGHGINYELWGATTICIKLGPYRGIARKYIDSDEIVTTICGPAGESSATIAGVAVVTHRLGILATELEDLRGKELENLRELCRAGEQSKALAGVAAIKSGATWPEHTPSFRARVLRFEAAVHLNLRRDPEVAARFVEEARQIDSGGDFQTISAYLAYCRHDIPAALVHVAAPRTSEARNFRWELLLETGELDALAQEANASTFPPDPETHRILALLALARADVPTARAAIAKAMETVPERKNIRLTKAAVDYFSTLSPAAEGMKRLAWAVPVSWIFIKSDTAAVASLRAAENEFLACVQHPDCLPLERENLCVWRLACVACVDYRQSEAAALVREILAENPACFGAIAWALHRGYPIDLAIAEAALRGRLAQEPENIDVWLALWSVTWASKGLEHGEAVVDEAVAAFRNSDNLDVWLFHKAQFVARKDQAAANELVAQIAMPDLKASAGVAILRAGSSAMKARRIFAQTLATEFATTSDPRRLFECCELKLRLGDFGYVAEHAKQLVTGVGTASALRLALEGTFKHGDYADCLSLLQDYRHLFRDGVLSPDVRQLRAMCQHQLGDWSEAARDLGQAYREDPKLATFVAYFDVLLRSGDTRRCSALSRDLVTLKGAKPIHWLRAAGVARLHDINLAKELWRLANRQPIKNLTLAALSLNLAFELGVSNEAAALFMRLHRLAQQGRGPMREKSFDEIVAVFQTQRETAEKNAKLYEQGAVPIHLLFELLNHRPLVFAYHEQLESNRSQSNLLHAPVLFARSGARRVEPTIPPKGLLADVSSLILAADLGILDKIEANFSPLYISPHATESLLEQVTLLHPSQPERQEARQKFRELVHHGKIAVVELVAEVTVVDAATRRQLGEEHASLLEIATRENGVVLHDGPFLAQDGSAVAVELPRSAADQIVPLSVLPSSLNAASTSGPRIADGTALLVPHHVIASLPAANIEAATRRFRLIVTSGAMSQLERDAEAFAHSQSLAAWTQTLLERIQGGIEAGTYRVIPNTGLQKELRQQASVTTQALVDLLIPTRLPDGVMWCDDRMINRHLRAGDRPLVGISEILTNLNKRGLLANQEFFDVLLRLRQSNVRYLPFADDEITYHLERAGVQDGRITETPALAVIRRYINACMLDKGRLQPHLVDSKGNIEVREYEFPMSLRRATDEALQAVWKNNAADVATRIARADWILENIYFDWLGMRQSLVEPTSAAEVRDLVANSVGMLFGDGIGFQYCAREAGESPRRAFFAWLESRFLTPLMNIEPVTASLVAKAISNYITSAANDPNLGKNPDERMVGRALWAHFIYDLPAELQNELDLPSAVQAQVGMVVHGVCVKIGDRIYPHRDYWEAMAKAVNGREGRVPEQNNNHVLVIRFSQREANSRVTVEFISDDPKECGRYSESAILVLTQTIDERIRFMESRAYWFDCGIAKRAEEIQRIAHVETPGERFEALDQWRRNSPEVAYRRIGALFSEPGNFGADDLYLPNWDRLLAHLRLTVTGAADTALPAAAKELLNDEGLPTALRRFICLPVRLPAVLETAWGCLPADEAAKIYNRLQRESHSLVADLHLLRLAVVREEPDLWKQAEEIAAGLLEPTASRPRFECFRAVLWLVDREFTRWRAGRNLPAWIRLACIWYHTSRLHGLMRRADDDLPRLMDWLEKSTNAWTEEVLARDAVFWGDRGRPGDVTHGYLVLHGIAHLLGDVNCSSARLGTDAKLKRLLEFDPSNGPSTRLELAHRSDLAGNVLGSFLGEATDPEIRAVFGDEAVVLFARASDEELAARLEDLAKTPDEPAYWMMMHGVIGAGAAPESLRPRLWEVLRTVSFDRLASRDVRILGPALTFACHQARASGDENFVRRMEAVIMGFARLAASQAQDKSAVLPLWLVLPNALLALAVVPGNEDESARRFFDMFRRFAELCPPLADTISGASMQWTKRLTFAQQVNLWPFIFTLRALR